MGTVSDLDLSATFRASEDCLGGRARPSVIGHDEVPNPDWPAHGPRFGGVDGHTDPGHYFDWDKLMRYATGG